MPEGLADDANILPGGMPSLQESPRAGNQDALAVLFHRYCDKRSGELDVAGSLDALRGIFGERLGFGAVSREAGKLGINGFADGSARLSLHDLRRLFDRVDSIIRPIAGQHASPLSFKTLAPLPSALGKIEPPVRGSVDGLNAAERTGTTTDLHAEVRALCGDVRGALIANQELQEKQNQKLMSFLETFAADLEHRLQKQQQAGGRAKSADGGGDVKQAVEHTQDDAITDQQIGTHGTSPTPTPAQHEDEVADKVTPTQCVAGDDSKGAEGVASTFATFDPNNLYQRTREMRWETEERQVHIFGRFTIHIPPVPNTGLGGFIQTRLEGISALVIIVNAWFIGFQAEYALDHPSAPASMLINIVNLSFCIYYTIEVILKLSVHKLYFFVNKERGWNWLDAMLVCSGIYDSVSTFVLSDAEGSSASGMLRLLRLFKMAKMLRVIRVMRFFRELRLLMKPLIGSLRTLFWTCAMFSIIVYVFGIVFLQAASGVLVEDHTENKLTEDQRSELYELWGSAVKSMITLYMAVTGGNDWGALAEPLKLAGYIYYFLFMMYVLFLSFAVLNVLTGVFVDAAMTYATDDRINVALENNSEETAVINKAEDACTAMGFDAAGGFTEAGLDALLNSDEMVGLMIWFDVQPKEVRQLFETMASEKSTALVDHRMFLQCCTKLKGTAKSSDVQTLLYFLQRMSTAFIERSDAMLAGLEQNQSLLCTGQKAAKFLPSTKGQQHTHVKSSEER
eukprot:gnl/TRDRNA2_/TRDRNA2_149966_c2_seq1.p1 gnl/TRDRNA2_/TRDRNA2_149966_c2~~gnl/TRDRNA2_/TRDRNA2_149966_c2_seq1.p1  ORF type:complete len:738 (-),score=138.72 gnl/TRDRNA2_/TRDRNA2_149966_c2_seq1:25-2238(-)